jgi:pilus assembly protein Flp/PilA
MLDYILYQLRNQKGQGMVEYGIIVAFIAVVCMAAFKLLGADINTMLGTIKFS